MIKRYRGEQLTLATTVGFAQVRTFPPGMNVLDIDPFHATTVEALLVAFGPRVLSVTFFDATNSSYFDMTAKLTDRNEATSPLAGSGGALNAMTSSDFIYVCLHHSARGLSVNVQGANAVASTLTGSYLDENGAWVTLGVTDGTTSGGATFATDGLITWTVPAPERWVSRVLPDGVGTVGMKKLKGHWLRLSTSATFTNPTSITAVAGLPNLTVDSVTVRSEGQAAVRVMSHNAARPMDRFYLDTDRYGSLEIASTSLTTAIDLNWYEDK